MLKGNKTIVLLAILVLLGAVYGVVKLTSGGGGRSKSFKDELVKLDTASVTKIEIETEQGGVILKKEDGQWMTDAGKKALNPSVKSMIGALNSIEPSRIAARSEEKWSDFQVDDSGTRVKVYEGGDRVLDLVIGRFGVEGQRSYFTYVRLSEDEDTYVANNFMGMSIGKSDTDYRNNSITRIEQDSVSSIDFVDGGNTVSLVKQGEEWVYGGVPADGVKVKNYLKQVQYLTSRNFEDGAPAVDGKQVIFHLHTGDISVSSYGASSLGSSTNEEIFTDSTTYQKVFVEPGFFLGQ